MSSRRRQCYLSSWRRPGSFGLYLSPHNLKRSGLRESSQCTNQSEFIHAQRLLILSAHFLKEMPRRHAHSLHVVTWSSKLRPPRASPPPPAARPTPRCAASGDARNPGTSPHAAAFAAEVRAGAAYQRPIKKVEGWCWSNCRVSPLPPAPRTPQSPDDLPCPSDRAPRAESASVSTPGLFRPPLQTRAASTPARPSSLCCSAGREGSPSCREAPSCAAMPPMPPRPPPPGSFPATASQ